MDDSDSNAGEDVSGVGREADSVVPRWIRLVGIIGLVVILLIVVMLLVGGGGHTPRRHTAPPGTAALAAPGAPLVV